MNGGKKQCVKNNRMLDFTELPEEDGFDLEELFQTPVQTEENDGENVNFGLFPFLKQEIDPHRKAASL